MDKREREVRRLAKKYGLTVVRLGSHFGLDDESGARVATASVSTGDRGSLKNLEGDIKRALKTKEE
jgi:hypothetical protein